MNYTLQYFCRYLLYHSSILWKALYSWNVLDQPLHTFFWDTDTSIRMDHWHSKRFLSIPGWWCIIWVIHSFFLIHNLLLLEPCMNGQDFVASVDCVLAYFIFLSISSIQEVAHHSRGCAIWIWDDTTWSSYCHLYWVQSCWPFQWILCVTQSWTFLEISMLFFFSKHSL